MRRLLRVERDVTDVPLDGTCARCGHATPTCARCGRDDLILGGYVADVGQLCHTFVDLADRPSCYELTVRGDR